MVATKVESDGARKLKEEIARVAGIAPPAQAEAEGSIGRTMFDTPGSQDMTITVLLSQERVQLAPSQSLVRIISRGDGRRYLGLVDAGPFAEPDSLRADSPILLAVATREANYLPRYHGRVQVKLLGEELGDGSLAPPRLRPLPHSPVYLLAEAETTKVLKAEGDVRLGLAVGHDEVVVGVPSQSKAVLPRHTAILGTTGGGKSTTVAGLVRQAANAGMAVVVLDVEGEYTFLHQPNDDPRMQPLLASRKLQACGVPVERMLLYHLVGRDTTNAAHPNLRPFSLQFARLSPYTVMAMLECNDAQTDRYLFAYEVSRSLMRDLGIFPQKDVPAEEKERQERFLTGLDDFERGYPRMRLSLLLDVVGACKAIAAKGSYEPYNAVLRTEYAQDLFKKYMSPKDVTNAASWGKVNSLLWRLHKLKVFDRTDGGARVLTYREMLRPGQVSVVDLSDAGLSELSNIAVADVLRGIQEEQERGYREFEAGKAQAPPRVLLVVEEAHEFLAAERIARTPHLFEQVARLAKRGRKRWMSLAFVTQLPQHLPKSVLGLCNNFVLHKLTDPHVVSTLKQTVSGVDDSLWSRLPGLAPGQAIVSMGHMARPILTSIDPSPCKLRMVE
jgi:DNA helicase HerA-like ATPase